MEYVLVLAQDIPHVGRGNTGWKFDFWFPNDPDQKPLMYIEVIYISFDRAHRIASNEVSFIGGSIKHRCHNIHKLGNDKLHVKITATRTSQIYRGYPEKLRFLSAFGVTRWIPSHLGIHGVTPKALKNLNFSGYPLTWIFGTRTSDLMTPLKVSCTFTHWKTNLCTWTNSLWLLKICQCFDWCITDKRISLLVNIILNFSSLMSKVESSIQFFTYALREIF